MEKTGVVVKGMLAALVAIGPLTMSMYVPSMPALVGALDTTPGMIKLTLSLYLAGYALGQLLYGPISDRFGRRGVVQVGIAMFVVGSLLCAMATSVETLLVARFLQAIGAGAGPTIARAMVRDLFERDEAQRMLATIGMALAVAPAIGPIIGGYLQVLQGWQAIFYALAAFGVALLTATRLGLTETLKTPDPTALEPKRLAANFRALLRDPTYLGYVGPAVGSLAGIFTFYAGAPFVVIGRLDVSPDIYGWYMLTTVVTFFLGTVAGRRYGSHLGIDRTITIGWLISASGALTMIAFAMSDTIVIWAIFGPMALWTGGAGLMLPAGMAGAMAPFPHMAGTASALLGFLQMGVGAVGGAVVAALGSETMTSTAIILCVFLVISGLLFRHPGRDRAAPPMRAPAEDRA